MSDAESVAVGRRAAEELAPLLARHKTSRLLLVTGKSSYQLSGAEAALAPLLGGLDVAHFSDFSPNPTLEEVEAGVAIWRSQKPDLVLVVGGGSALDLAKMINGLAASRESARDLLTGVVSLEGSSVPCIAVPTTSGSGAETTHFAAVYVDGKKYSVTHESLRPTYCILDASLTHSLPSYLTAATGMDALAQAIESYWSVRSTAESRRHSAEAIELCAPALGNWGEASVSTAPTPAAREALMQGSHLAGKAIDIARTTAPHALSYVLTTDFGVTHGHAVALTLGSVFSFNAQASESASIEVASLAALQQTMGELSVLLKCPDGEATAARLKAMMKACGLQTQLRDVGVTRSDLPRLVASVNPQRLKNNPRTLSSEDLGVILEAVY
ncbi:MAG: phosphonoacetaldehyde reductase [Myxococcales bacterium]|nr:phosphonoacetaldehyde reductase [Myxococcales bacterium]